MDRVEEADQISSNLWVRFIFSLFLFLLRFGTANLGSRIMRKKWLMIDSEEMNEPSVAYLPHTNLLSTLSWLMFREVMANVIRFRENEAAV